MEAKGSDLFHPDVNQLNEKWFISHLLFGGFATDHAKLTMITEKKVLQSDFSKFISSHESMHQICNFKQGKFLS